MRVWHHVAEALAGHGRCALVSVIAARGSVPREEGAMMVVGRDGYHGTIGGGALEWQALAQAQAALAGPAGARILSRALGPDLGQCCGGHVDVAIEVFDVGFLGEARDLAARESAGPFVLERSVGGRAVSQQFGNDHRTVFLFGAGHVGRALALALAPLPVRLRWVESRPAAFPALVPRNAEAIHAEDPVAALAAAPAGSLAFIMTHSHALDLALADAALRNPALAHVGLIGSATKRARFAHRLSAAGVDAARISGLICPIGVPGTASKLPAVIAAATAAQILVLDAALRLVTAPAKPQKPEMAKMRTGT